MPPATTVAGGVSFAVQRKGAGTPSPRDNISTNKIPCEPLRYTPPV